MTMTKQEILKLKRFIEELAWLMESYSKIDLKKAAMLIDDSIGETSEVRKAMGAYESQNPNIHFLIGVLPSLFLDESIFKTNDDIADFAADILEVNIPRHQKKSKYEIIGHIVCETSRINEKRLDKLVRALSVLINDEKGKKIIAERKRDNTSFSWNDMIQSLIKE